MKKIALTILRYFANKLGYRLYPKKRFYPKYHKQLVSEGKLTNINGLAKTMKVTNSAAQRLMEVFNSSPFCELGTYSEYGLERYLRNSGKLDNEIIIKFIQVYRDLGVVYQNQHYKNHKEKAWQLCQNSIIDYKTYELITN